MNESFYKQIIEQSLFGYAYHKIILDKKGIPIDYEFIDVNEAFEKLTGLKKENILNKRVTTILPDIQNIEFDWVSFYGEIALNNGENEFKQYSKPLNRHYHVKVYSPKKYYFITIFTDITTHKQIVKKSKEVEKDLIKSQKKYYNLAEEAPIGIITCDIEGNITYVNSKIVKILDSPSIEKTKEINLLKFPPLIKYGMSDKLERCIKNKELITYEANYVSKWGKDIWLRLHFKPQIDKDEVKGVRIIVDDITKSKYAEEKLKLSEQNYRSIFETIDDMIFISSKNGKILYVNSSTTKKLGYSLEEMKQMHICNFYKESDRKKAKQIFYGMFEGKYNTCPLPWITKQGTFLTVETRIWVGVWDEKECIFIISKDLSKEQEALQKFNRLFKSNPALMALTNVSNKTFTEVNDAFLLKTGYTKEEIIGKTSKELDLFPEWRKQEEINDELQKFGHINNIELKIKTKDGNILDGLFYGEIIESQGKRYSLTVMIDITELNKTREKIEYLSYHDQLTGLYNRRFFDEELKRLDTSRNLPLSLLMVDVNGLKLVNDAFGHKTGDELLKSVAIVMKKECRADDIIARIGGDEFIIILPKTNSCHIKMIARRLTENIDNEKIADINISTSCGWYTKNHEGEDIADIFKKAEEYMYKRKLFESKSMRYKTIEIIMNTLYEKNAREQQHSIRVSQLSAAIGIALKLSSSYIRKLQTSGLMHDIGKTAISEKILNKPGPLNSPEWLEIERHPEIGYRILSSVNEYALLAKYVLAHHERWDGKGYPEGLKREEIPLVSRIIAIADSYDAMTSDRSYRRALSKETAIEEIRKNAGIKYDAHIVNVFIEKVLLEDNIE